jgi:hypothetical protein
VASGLVVKLLIFFTENGTDPITFTHARSWFDKLTLSLSQGVEHTF